MDRYLITGFSGFVSAHFLEFLGKQPEKSVVMGVDIHEPSINLHQYEQVQCSFTKLDLLDANAMRELLISFKPNYILHLASFSSVAFSWQEPVSAIVNNLNIFLNLVDQVRKLQIPCRILSVGSSEEYGKVDAKDMPLVETFRVNPISPYAVARVSQEQLSKVYSDGYGLDIIMTRSFNHIGPGQTEKFVIPAFVNKIQQARTNGLKEIQVGRTDIYRDFVDVRDVVRAYYLLFKGGRKSEIYNICSGKGLTLYEILDKLMTKMGVKLEIKTDAQLVRPSDNEIIIGSYQKLSGELGWHPEISLDQSLDDIIRYWENKSITTT